MIESFIFTKNLIVKYFFTSLISLLLISCGGESTEQNNTDAENAVVVDSIPEIDSLQYYSEQIAAHPKNADWHYKRAVYTLSNGNLMSSKADLEVAILLDSTNLDVRLMYGNLQLSLTHIDTSKYHYDYILRKDSANTGALLGMSKLYALLNNSAMADAYISSALKVDPYLAEAYFMRGIIYRTDYYDTGREESRERALSSFQTTVEQDPDFYAAYVEMGVMYDEAGSDLSLEYYNSALDIFPESQEAWYNIGMFHQNRGNVEAALVAYRTLNTIDSLWAEPYYNQGNVHLLLNKDYDSAVFFFSKAVELNPNHFKAYNNMGLAYEDKNDLTNARRYYSKAVDIDPNFQLAKDNLNRIQ